MICGWVSVSSCKVVTDKTGAEWSSAVSHSLKTDVCNRNNTSQWIYQPENLYFYVLCSSQRLSDQALAFPWCRSVISTCKMFPPAINGATFLISIRLLQLGRSQGEVRRCRGDRLSVCSLIIRAGRDILIQNQIRNNSPPFKGKWQQLFAGSQSEKRLNTSFCEICSRPRHLLECDKTLALKITWFIYIELAETLRRCELFIDT